MPAYYPEGDVPKPWDNELRTLQKILSLTSGGGGGGGGGGGVLSGTDNPEGSVLCASGSCVYVQKPAGLLWTYAGIAGGTTGWA